MNRRVPTDLDRHGALIAALTAPILRCTTESGLHSWPSALALLDECGLTVVPKVPTEEMMAAIPYEITWWNDWEECAGSLNAYDTVRWLSEVIAAAPKIEPTK